MKINDAHGSGSHLHSCLLLLSFRAHQRTLLRSVWKPCLLCCAWLAHRASSTIRGSGSNLARLVFGNLYQYPCSIKGHRRSQALFHISILKKPLSSLCDLRTKAYKRTMTTSELYPVPGVWRFPPVYCEITNGIFQIVPRWHINKQTFVLSFLFIFTVTAAEIQCCFA